MPSWFKVMADIHKHPKVVALPTDASRWAFVVTLAEGKATSGIWQSVKHYRVCLGSLSRWLPAFLETGLMDTDVDGVLSVHDWAEYQKDSDPKAADRARQWREKQKANAVPNAPRTVSERHSAEDANAVRTEGERSSARALMSLSFSSPSPTTDSEPSGLANGHPMADPWHELVSIIAGLTNEPYPLPNRHAGLGLKASNLLKRHGLDALVVGAQTICSTRDEPPTAKQLTWALEDYLDPPLKVSRRDVEASEHDTAVARLKAKANGAVR